MGLLNTFSAWIGNSQAFALNSIAEDSFALENLTYAVSHHTTTGLPHLYTLTNLYHSYGLVAGIGSGLALLVALLLASTSYKDKKVSLLSVFPSLFNNGAPFMVGIPVLLNLLLRWPWLFILCQLRFIQFQMVHQVFFSPLSELGVVYELLLLVCSVLQSTLLSLFHLCVCLIKYNTV